MISRAATVREGSPQAPMCVALWERFRKRNGLDVPGITPLRSEEMPEPYKRLLVHSQDMTSTLENFYGGPLGISVLSRELEGDAYLREVVLKPAGEAPPVEYGVIRICLDQLPAKARRRVLEEERPLGNILSTEAVPFLSWPQSFFRVGPDAYMVRVLGLRQPGILYGRRNLLLDGSRHLLAEVLEVLAPAVRVNSRETSLPITTQKPISRV